MPSAGVSPLPSPPTGSVDLPVVEGVVQQVADVRECHATIYDAGKVWIPPPTLGKLASNGTLAFLLIHVELASFKTVILPAQQSGGVDRLIS